MQTKLLGTLVATASLLALQASAFAQTATLHPKAPSASHATPSGRPLYNQPIYNQVSPQQFNAQDDYRNGGVSADSARGGIGH
jgi:hypothetical protein